MSSGAPLKGISVAVSRQTDDGEPAGGWTPDEILPIERALSSYTAGVAHQAFAEDGWGRFDARRECRLLWLNRDPRTTAALELPALGIEATYLHGRPVYSATD